MNRFAGRIPGRVETSCQDLEYLLNFEEILTEADFSYPPHATEPDDGALLPRAGEQFQSETPVYHMQLYLHIVVPNVNALIGPMLFAAARARERSEVSLGRSWKHSRWMFAAPG